MTPRLRFPEFAGDRLLQVQLGDVTADCTTRNGKSLTLGLIMGVSKTDGIIPMEERLIGRDVGRYKRLMKDEFAYNPMRINIGSIARWKGDGEVLVSPDYIVFRCLNEGDSAISPEYLDHFRCSDQWEDFISGSGDGGVRIRIYYKDLARLPLSLPAPAEQQKIADCLTSLDGAVTAQGRKVEALKAHKKGLMQQLFPREGESLPRLRFPEFRDDGVWRRVALGDLLSGKPEYGVNAAAVPFSEDLPAYLRITDIADDGRYIADGKVSVDIDATEENYLSIGDIALARTGASVGKSYRYRPEDGRLVFAGFLIRISPDTKKLVPTLLSNYMTTQEYWDWVRVTSARSGQPGINGTEYASLSVPIPPPSDGKDELAEQQRIAACLSALDARIAAESAKLAALKTHKKGLMQQLFPSGENS